MSAAQRHPLGDDRKTFAEDVGVELEAAFEAFDPEPVASASLAQACYGDGSGVQGAPKRPFSGA